VSGSRAVEAGLEQSRSRSLVSPLSALDQLAVGCVLDVLIAELDALLRCYRQVSSDVGAAVGVFFDEAPHAARVCIMRCRTNTLQRMAWNGSRK
jgi:hypothetical protein